MKPDFARVPKAWHGPLQEYVALVQALADRRLRSLIVLDDGPAAPALRSVAVLDAIELDFVRQLGAQGPALGRRRLQAPLLMTPDYIRASLDVFPIELLEIQQRRVVVLGEDHFGGLTFKKSDVRLEIERELKREMIQVRQGVLSAGDRSNVLAEIHADARAQTLRLLRAVLWLYDRPAPAAAPDLLQVAGELTGLELSALKVDAAPGGDAFGEVESLYDLVISLANCIDQLPS